MTIANPAVADQRSVQEQRGINADDAEEQCRIRVGDEHRGNTEGLTERERRFVAAYIGAANGIAARACEAAGYSAESRGALAVQGHRLLCRPRVVAAISAEREKRAGAPSAPRQSATCTTAPT
jgi:hypothetical protein